MTQKPVIVRQVWASNLESEILHIERAIIQYPFVTMDTEFPGTIYQPNLDKQFLPNAPSWYNYTLLKLNVDILRIIQLGLTLSDSKGNLPSFGTKLCYVWQFNFRDFNVERDPHNAESVELLEQQGINFKRYREKGVNSWDFANLVLKSGLVSNPSCVTWITFHGAYDIAFMIKILTKDRLPPDFESFMGLVSYYLGVRVYDTKFMMACIGGLHGGLDRLAKLLGVERIIGISHHAGSDSLLTMRTFMRFRDSCANIYPEIFNGFEGMILGLCEGRLPEFNITSCNTKNSMNASSGYCGLDGPELIATSDGREGISHQVEVQA